MDRRWVVDLRMDVGQAGELDGISSDCRSGAINQEGEFLAFREWLPWLGEVEANVVANNSSEESKGDGSGLWWDEDVSAEALGRVSEQCTCAYLQSSGFRECEK